MQVELVLNCLIQLYNEDKISGLISILALAPSKVIMLYDGSFEQLRKIENLARACSKALPKLEFEYKNYENVNVEKTIEVFSGIIHKNDGCCLNITGANEVGAIGAYLACVKNFVPVFKLDLYKNQFVNIKGLNSLENKKIPGVLTVDSLFLANGAILGVSPHPVPSKIMYTEILKFCPFIFNNIDAWKKLCYYIQTGVNHYPQTSDSNMFWAPKEIQNTKNETVFNNEYILKEASTIGLINNLDICDDTVSFKFKNELYKKYFTDFGSWLELYCYVNLMQNKMFRDVKLSVKIGWVKQTFGFEGVVNEIDVIFFYQNTPCFVSCKIAQPTVSALEELNMYSTYFGGRYSKTILVTLSKIDKSSSRLYKRAESMGILLIDGDDIKSGNFTKKIIGQFKT